MSCSLFVFPPPQDRAGTNSPLSFEVVGGWELGHPIFVSTVEPNSIPERAGLRVGDQVSVSFLYLVWELVTIVPQVPFTDSILYKCF